MKKYLKVPKCLESNKKVVKLTKKFNKIEDEIEEIDKEMKKL